MRPAWFIQLRKNHPSDQKIAYAAMEHGMSVFMEPYEHGSMKYDFLPNDVPVVVYGSVALLQDLTARREELPFQPAVWCDWPSFQCRTFFEKWEPWLLQRKYDFIPMGEIERRWDALVDEFGVNERVFLRPDGGDKDFNGGLVRRDFFKAWLGSAQRFSPSPESLVVVASPERILAEYRLFAAAGQVVAGSKYKTGDFVCPEPGFPDPAAEVAEAAAKIWSPGSIFCIDVAETPLGFRVVECNPFNMAGVYESDLRLLTAAAEKVAMKEWGR
jgi:hypothetical protein